MPKVEIKLSSAALGRLDRIVQDAALEAVGQLRTAVNNAQVMPFDYGKMQNDFTSVVQLPDGEDIHTMLVTDTAYARRLYFHPEYNFQDANNKNAQGLWLQRWLPGGDQESFLPETFSEVLRRRLRE